MNKKGIVHLVGAGPGDPELLTLKGETRLKECDVLIYDRLASESLLDLAPRECEKIYVGKGTGNHSSSQEEINRIIVAKALEGKRVVRLKGGDPYVFGRGGEEVLALQEAGIPYEVIPGITSAIAAAAYAGIPVTHRGISQSFHVITGHTEDGDNQLTDNYETLAKLEGTLVFLMGMGNLSRIITELCKYGKDRSTPAAVISNGTTGKQKAVRGTLYDIESKVARNNLKAPAVIIIGQVAELNMENSLKGPLSGIRVGVTGTKKLADKLIRLLKEYGADTQDLSYMYVKEFEDNTELNEAVRNLPSYTWIVFTSTNGVNVFFNYLRRNQIDYRKLSGISFAAVGSGTREALLKQGFYADYVPPVYTTVSLAEGLAELLTKKDRVLIPRAVNGSEDLTGILNRHHISYREIKVYSIEIEKEKRDRVMSGLTGYDYITFASASGVEGFFGNMKEELPEKLQNTRVVCIGGVTAAKLAGYGINDCMAGEEYSVSGMVECILSDVKTKLKEQKE